MIQQDEISFTSDGPTTPTISQVHDEMHTLDAITRVKLDGINKRLETLTQQADSQGHHIADLNKQTDTLTLRIDRLIDKLARYVATATNPLTAKEPTEDGYYLTDKGRVIIRWTDPDTDGEDTLQYMLPQDDCSEWMDWDEITDTIDPTDLATLHRA